MDSTARDGNLFNGSWVLFVANVFGDRNCNLEVQIGKSIIRYACSSTLAPKLQENEKTFHSSFT